MVKKIMVNLFIVCGYSALFLVQHQPVYSSSSTILINEVYYDPEGADTGYEWMELKNISSQTIDIGGWTIQLGGSVFAHKAVLPSYFVDPGTIVLIGEPQVTSAHITLPSLALQNGGSESDGIRILNPEGMVIDTLLYDFPNTNNLPDDASPASSDSASDVASGHSLSRVSQVDTDSSSADFTDCDNPSPGQENSFHPTAVINSPSTAFIGQEITFDGTDSFDPDSPSGTDPLAPPALVYHWAISKEDNSFASSGGDSTTFTFEIDGTYTISLVVTDIHGLTGSATTEITVSEDPANPRITSIAECRKLDVGSIVTIEGTITAPPGVIYSSDGYIQDETGGIRLKVPSETNLQLSSSYRISGTVSSVYGELRLNIVSSSLSAESDAVPPISANQTDIAHLVGSLVEIELVVKAKRGKTLEGFVENPEIITPVFISDMTGISLSDIGAGSTLTVTGIVSRYGTNEDGTPKIRLMPRFESDMMQNTSQALTQTGSPLFYSLWGVSSLAIILTASLIIGLIRFL